MDGRIAPVLAVLLMAVGDPCAAVQASAEANFDAQLEDRVKASIDVGLRYLRFQQAENGSWADSPRATALVVRALAESHRAYEEADGPFMRKGFAYLSRLVARESAWAVEASISDLALVSMALGRARTETYRGRAQDGLELLLRRLEAGGEGELDAQELGFARQSLRASGLPHHHPVLDQGQPAPSVELERALKTLWTNPAPYEQAYFLVLAFYEHRATLRLDADGEEPTWRVDIAQRLVGLQEFQGSWQGARVDVSEEELHVGTSLALLALERIYAD